MAYLLPTAGDMASISNAVAAANGDLVPAADVGVFTTAMCQLTGTWVGTVTFQGSAEDVPTNWVSLTAINITSGAMGATATANGLYALPLTCKWFRIRVTAYTSGTVTGYTVFSFDDASYLQANNVGGTVNLSGGSTNIGAFGAVNIAGNNLTAVRVTSAASGVFKASTGRLYHLEFYNTNAAARYLQVYQKATAGVPGTDTPTMTFPLAANGKLSWVSEIGIYQTTGTSWAVTTDAAGTTAGAGGDIVGTAFYA